jgi:uracil-DNA glycosylase
MPFLRRTIEVVNPTLVIGLGRVALEALRRIADHQCDLKKCAGTVVAWNQRYLGVLYHPGPRTVVHRPWAEQLKDAKRIAAFAHDLSISVRTIERPALLNESRAPVATGGGLQTARELD